MLAESCYVEWYQYLRGKDRYYERTSFDWHGFGLWVKYFEGLNNHLYNADGAFLS